jgi:hypothetical protein
MHSPEPLQERQVADRDEFLRITGEAQEPFVIRGLVRDWPLCAAARESADALFAYLEGFYNHTPVSLMLGAPDIDGRLFYAEGFRRLNFQTRTLPFVEAFRAILAVAGHDDPPTIHMGSAAESRHWLGLARANRLPLLDGDICPNLWIGGCAVVGPHNDYPDNLACVVAGRRRFRLFPPQQFANLYVGPTELNPAGRPVSFVSVTNPDFERFPRYANALAASRDAVLDPGDAIFIPSMWWHSVESLAPVNLLVNYWWEPPGVNAARADAALIHALLAMGPMPAAQRRAWQAMFEHLVFRTDDDPVAHIPPEIRGWLGELTPDLRDKMRNFIRRSLME